MPQVQISPDRSPFHDPLPSERGGGGAPSRSASGRKAGAPPGNPFDELRGYERLVLHHARCWEHVERSVGGPASRFFHRLGRMLRATERLARLRVDLAFLIESGHRAEGVSRGC